MGAKLFSAVVGLTAVGVLAAAPSAHAGSESVYPPETTVPVSVGPPPTRPAPLPVAVLAPSTRATELPATGSDTNTILQLGAAVTAAGALAAVAARSRRPRTA